MPIVADATVFRYLVIVDATAILPALFGFNEHEERSIAWIP
jgi:hypothetical protein